jgi:pyruvate/2-oxoglutarate dehydrogenase complex dihydrolipoamide dehydrogenase (E3) component
MSSSTYQVLIIGGGQAGVPLARELAQRGLRVALAERRDLGGSCVNFGCTPTKAALASARVAHLARRGREFGLRVPVVEVDFAAVLERAKGILLPARAGLREAFHGDGEPELIAGHARLAGRDGQFLRIAIGERQVSAEQVVLDTGTRTRLPDLPGIEEVDYLHAGNWLERPELPAHLLVLGAGFVGLEMAQLYRRMGSRVTVVSRGGLLAGEDRDVARALQQLLEAEDIRFLLDAEARRVRPGRDGLELGFHDRRGRHVVSGSHLFVATGRRPNTDDLGLASVGLRCDRRGFVPVDDRLATSVAGVWAAGDIRGGPMFTHTAWDDHRVLLSQIAGDRRRTCARVPVHALFTDPELGRVGATEEEARRRLGARLRVGRHEMRRNGRARERGDSEGFVRVLVDADSERLVGGAALSLEGAEIIHCLIDVIQAGAAYRAILDAVHIHPTLAEAVQSAVAALAPAP